MILTIATVALFLFIIGFWVLAAITNLGDSRPFNPDWVNELRNPGWHNRHEQRQITGNHIDLREIAVFVYPALTFLDSAGVVRVLRKFPNAHAFLDFVDGTVQWRVQLG